MDRLVGYLLIRTPLLLGLLCAFLLVSRQADAIDIFKLDELTIDYRNYAAVNPNNRPLLIYPEKAKEGLNLDMNIDVFKYAYFDTNVESYTTGSQYRSIGLQMALGIRVADCLQLGYYHHSQHVLDREEFFAKYPVEDAIEVKLVIFKANPRPSLFGGK